MAHVTLGVGTSHSPMLSMPPDEWSAYQVMDRNNHELIDTAGVLRDYASLLARADPAIAQRVSQDTFNKQHAACQAAITQLTEKLRHAAPDVLLAIGDDQDELFFDDNYPAISI